MISFFIVVAIDVISSKEEGPAKEVGGETITTIINLGMGILPLLSLREKNMN